MTLCCWREGARVVVLSDDVPWATGPQLGKFVLVRADVRTAEDVRREGESKPEQIADYLRQEFEERASPALENLACAFEHWLAGE